MQIGLDLPTIHPSSRIPKVLPRRGLAVSAKKFGGPSMLFSCCSVVRSSGWGHESESDRGMSEVRSGVGVGV